MLRCRRIVADTKRHFRIALKNIGQFCGGGIISVDFVEGARGGRLRVLDAVQDVRRVVAAEGPLAGEQLVEDDAERVDVGLGIGLLAAS